MENLSNIGQIGFPLMIVGMVVVFSALLILMYLMKALKKMMHWLHCRKLNKASQTSGISSAQSCPNPDDTEALTIAAIALTLILEDEAAHDHESLVLTLHTMPKPYSNWWMPGTMTAGGFKSSGFPAMSSKIENT